MPLLPNPQHEAFAQARFSGRSLVEAHYAAGYAGDKSSASRLGQLFEVKERIAELHREAAAKTLYEKAHAVRDLLSIIHACPSDASDDNPLCEVRMGKDGPYYRFPPKLQAMARLIKLMGWDHPEEIEIALKDNFVDLLARIRRPGNHAPSCSSSSSSSPSTVAPPPSDPLEPISPIGLISPIPATPALPSTLTPHPSTHQSPHPSTELPSYQKADAIHDLVTIIHALPSHASPDHPLCEMRQSGWGSYCRFPSKLAAIVLLIRMLGWAHPARVEVEHDPDAKFKQLTECIRQRS